MKYSKILLGAFIFFGLGIVSSCDVNDEFYDELDKADAKANEEYEFYSDKTLIETGYILTDDDYALSSNEDVVSRKNFSIDAAAADNLVEILTSKKLFGEAGVEYSVMYNYYRGYSDAFASYRKNLKVGSEEYSTVSAAVKELGFFTSNNSAVDNIPTLLAAANPNAEKGDVSKFTAYEANKSIAAAKYLVMGEDEYKVIIDAVKADDAKKHLVDSEYGTSEYYYGSNTYSKNFDARVSKWAAYPDYSTMVEDDLEDLIYNRMVEGLIVLLKNQYTDATILDAGGNEITYVVKYAVYDGKKTKTKYLRFKCVAEGDALDFERVGSMYVDYKTELYIFDGTDWNVEDDIYRLESEDYDAMGTDYGFPGKYDNFDSDMAPANYLPVFMNTKWIYAQEGDIKIIGYKYYNSGNTELRADEYVFTKDLGWHETATMVEASSLVAFKDRAWVVIPPIKLIKSENETTLEYTVIKSDYVFVGDTGFENFYVKGMSAEEAEASIKAKLIKIIKNNFELAIGNVYEMSYVYYDGATQDAKMKLEAVEDN